MLKPQPSMKAMATISELTKGWATSMKLLIRIMLCSLMGLASAAHANAGFDEPMSFYRATSGGNCSSCVWIAAEGVIERDTDQKFLQFLSDEGLLGAKGLNVHLNSPGGNLIGGVMLGLAIRGQEANTVVSAAIIEEIYDDGLRKVTFDPSVEGQCSSSCVFAFAGGVSRFASNTTPGGAVGFQKMGRLGVHQFYTPQTLEDPSALAFDAEDRIVDQRIIAILLAYLSEMEVSAELLQIAAMTDPRDMHYLTEEELRRTEIDNRMVHNVFLTGYRNGVAITEITYRRPDADYRLEVYCDRGDAKMLVSIDWRGFYDVEGHQRWNLFGDVSLSDGGSIELIEQEFFKRTDGGVTGQLRFRFVDPLATVVARKDFSFEDWSSRYANDAATSMSFTLPDDFDGLYLLPKACLR